MNKLMSAVPMLRPLSTLKQDTHNFLARQMAREVMRRNLGESSGLISSPWSAGAELSAVLPVPVVLGGLAGIFLQPHLRAESTIVGGVAIFIAGSSLRFRQQLKKAIAGELAYEDCKDKPIVGLIAAVQEVKTKIDEPAELEVVRHGLDKFSTTLNIDDVNNGNVEKIIKQRKKLDIVASLMDDAIDLAVEAQEPYIAAAQDRGMEREFRTYLDRLSAKRLNIKLEL